MRRSGARLVRCWTAVEGSDVRRGAVRRSGLCPDEAPRGRLGAVIVAYEGDADDEVDVLRRCVVSAGCWVSACTFTSEEGKSLCGDRSWPSTR